jgi:prepilin-type N-terminal cleavage/methylation domain-containing protein
MSNRFKNLSPLQAARPSAQRGYTIVELSIAVAIAGVLLVSAIGLVQTVLTTNRANESITLLTKAMSQIDKIWADQPAFADLSLATAGAAGVFNGMQVTRNSTQQVDGVISKFNRPIWVGLAPNLPTAGANRGYTMTFAGVPVSVCADLVTAAAGGGIRGIIVTPEATPTTTSAAIIPAGMSATGALTPPTGTHAIALDGSMTNVSIPNTMGVNGCGTNQSTVALTFVNWK